MQPPSKLAELLLRIEQPRAPRRDFATPAGKSKVETRAEAAASPETVLSPQLGLKSWP